MDTIPRAVISVRPVTKGHAPGEGRLSFYRHADGCVGANNPVNKSKKISQHGQSTT
jgi:hypothetical protein